MSKVSVGIGMRLDALQKADELQKRDVPLSEAPPQIRNMILRIMYIMLNHVSGCQSQSVSV